MLGEIECLENGVFYARSTFSRKEAALASMNEAEKFIETHFKESLSKLSINKVGNNAYLYYDKCCVAALEPYEEGWVGDLFEFSDKQIMGGWDGYEEAITEFSAIIEQYFHNLAQMLDI